MFHKKHTKTIHRLFLFLEVNSSTSLPYAIVDVSKALTKRLVYLSILGINGNERNITITTTKAFPNHFFKEKAL